MGREWSSCLELGVGTPTTRGKGRRERYEEERLLALLASLFSHARLKARKLYTVEEKGSTTSYHFY